MGLRFQVAEGTDRLRFTARWGRYDSRRELDENGRNRTLWPGYTFTFRRRTKVIDPAHHELIA